MQDFDAVEEYVLNLEIIGSMPDRQISKIANKLEVLYEPAKYYLSRKLVELITLIFKGLLWKKIKKKRQTGFWHF